MLTAHSYDERKCQALSKQSYPQDRSPFKSDRLLSSSSYEQQAVYTHMIFDWSRERTFPIIIYMTGVNRMVYPTTQVL